MEKIISKNWVFFIDKNPCVDEYYDEGFGLYFWGWCLVGILWKPNWRRTGIQFGIILLNLAVGFWRDGGKDRE